MANYDNIKNHKFNKLTAEKQREIARKGGKASVCSRRKKRSIKELFRAIGDLPVNDNKIKLQLEKMGIPKEDQTWEVAVAVSGLIKAMKTDNPKMLEFILELLDKGGVDNG